MGKTILTLFQKKILDFLSKNPDFTSNFYFTGGTALAEYYLQHRFSEDLDFFSENEIDDLWLNILTKKLREHIKIDKVDIQKSFNRNLVFISIQDEIIKTEFTYFPFKPIEEPKLYRGMKVDSLIDIAVNKFFTVYQKPTARHFIDLFLILKKGIFEWSSLKKLARIKFDTVIDPLQLGTSLIQAKEVSGLPKMIINLEEKAWRDYFYTKALDLKSEIKK
jgi:predicted nucleotidyltransferase component of viral defense system